MKPVAPDVLTARRLLKYGRWLKSKNQGFNKRRAKLVHHKDKQGINTLLRFIRIILFRAPDAEAQREKKRRLLL
ncbi:MAG: hypothetical protein ACRC2R_00535 [Xenococcaceae cyanobacterium]